MCLQAKIRCDPLCNRVVSMQISKYLQYPHVEFNLGVSNIQSLFSFVFVCCLGTLISSTCSVTGSKFQYHHSLRGPMAISRRLKESVATGINGASVLGYV